MKGADTELTSVSNFKETKPTTRCGRPENNIVETFAVERFPQMESLANILATKGLGET